MPRSGGPGRSHCHPVTAGQHDATLQRLADAGLPLTAIGAALGCSGPTVCQRLQVLRQAAGGPRRKPMASYIDCRTGRPTRRAAGASA